MSTLNDTGDPDLIDLTDVLLDHNGIIKYVDFGAAKVIARQGRTLMQDISATKPNKSMTGTPMYMSPEVIKGENPGHFGAVDIWSLGVILYICLCGFPPFSEELYSRDFPFKLGQQITSGRFDYPSPYWDSVGDVTCKI